MCMGYFPLLSRVQNPAFTLYLILERFSNNERGQIPQNWELMCRATPVPSVVPVTPGLVSLQATNSFSEEQF